MSRRGRPVGSRNAVSRPHRIMVRLTEDERGWLLARAGEGTESDVVRGLIDEARRMEMHGRLIDYRTGEDIREATAQEQEQSREQAKRDGGAGVITVDGRVCYVQD